jgi:hypothetical protein
VTYSCRVPNLNPYTPGSGTAPPILAGRDDQLALIDSAADQVEANRQANPMIFVGLRGMGKTSLLQTCQDRLRSRGWLAGWTETRNKLDPRDAIRNIVAEAAGMSVPGLQNELANGEHSINGTTLQRRSGGFSFGIEARPEARDAYDDLVAFLRRIGSAARRNKVGVALLIDELQIFHKRDLAILVQAISAVKTEPVVLIGAGLPHLPTVMAKANTYAERFRFEKIDDLDEEAARLAVTGPAAAEGVAWKDDALELLLAHCDGYPYFIQLYASETWNRRDGTSAIETHHVRSALASAQRVLDSGLYTARFERLSPKERDYVGAMVTLINRDRDVNVFQGIVRGDLIESGRIAKSLDKPMTAVAPVRDSIIRKGIIHSPVRGLLAFSVPGFADYVTRHFLDNLTAR